ncbi:MAG: hypothetical protein WA129_07615 [Acidovorax sp.]
MNQAHISVASPLGDSVQAVGRVIGTFAWQHMKAATTFRNKVAALGGCRAWKSSAANRPQRSIFGFAALREHRLFAHSRAMGLQIRQKLSSLGPILAKPSVFAVRRSKSDSLLETANPGKEFGSFFEDVRSYGSGCIMSAAASLEALINECFIDPVGPLRTQLTDFESQFWGPGGIEWKSPLEKYQIALTMLGKSRLDEHASPFKDTWALVELRNALVHYKPTWDPDRQRKVDMIEVLSGKYDLSPFPGTGADFVAMRSI